MDSNVTNLTTLITRDVYTRQEVTKQTWLKDRSELDKLWDKCVETANEDFERRMASYRQPEPVLRDARRQLRNFAGECRKELKVYRNLVTLFLTQIDNQTR